MKRPRFSAFHDGKELMSNQALVEEFFCTNVCKTSAKSVHLKKFQSPKGNLRHDVPQCFKDIVTYLVPVKYYDPPQELTVELADF